MIVAMWCFLSVGGEHVFSLVFHHSERVFAAQPPRKPKPSKGLRLDQETYEHVFDLGGEHAYAHTHDC